jgi:hypothetical protein
MADTTTATQSRPSRHDASVRRIAATKLMDRLKVSHPQCFDASLGYSEEQTLDQIADALRSAWGGDGYEIAKALEHDGWDVDAALVSELDGGCLEEAYDERVRLWIAEHGITPKLAIGTAVAVLEQPTAQGEIAGIDQERGTYTVCVPAWGHVKKGNGTHGRVWPWEVVEGWQASA